MTATQVFLYFLKKKCTKKEYIFFKSVICHDNGNRYFRKRKLYTDTFVEDYLSRNGRALNNFMMRMFILAPNLKNRCLLNPRFKMIKDTWCEEHEGKMYTKPYYDFTENRYGRYNVKVKWNAYKGIGMYVTYYTRLWNKFLREEIDDGEKRINSPFKKGEKYCFKLKEKRLNDSCI